MKIGWKKEASSEIESERKSIKLITLPIFCSFFSARFSFGAWEKRKKEGKKKSIYTFYSCTAQSSSREWKVINKLKWAINSMLQLASSFNNKKRRKLFLPMHSTSDSLCSRDANKMHQGRSFAMTKFVNKNCIESI